MYLDPLLLGAIAAVFGTATTGLGWLVARLWKDRDEAVEKFLEMLRLQFADTESRRDLWAKLTQSVVDQSRAVDTLRQAFIDNARLVERFERTIDELRSEVRRLQR